GSNNRGDWRGWRVNLTRAVTRCAVVEGETAKAEQNIGALTLDRRPTMVDFLGTIVTAALMVVVVNALVVYLEIGRSANLALAAAVGLWIGLAAAASASGWLAISTPFPIMGIFVATPLVAAAIVTAWPGVRTALMNLPTPLMVGLNFFRVFAVLFFVLASQGRLAGPFPFFAGWGDIITRVLALPLWFGAAAGRQAGGT